MRETPRARTYLVIACLVSLLHFRYKAGDGNLQAVIVDCNFIPPQQIQFLVYLSQFNSRLR